MNFTFGIITCGQNDHYLLELIKSIYQQQIENYEIIIVGSTTVQDDNIIYVNFDETIKNGWITKKKNIICQLASIKILYLFKIILN